MTMLVLRRKKNETLAIGDNITINVLEVSGNTVKLGIDAPPELLILRGEIKVTDVNRNRPQTAVGDDDGYSVIEYLI